MVSGETRQGQKVYPACLKGRATGFMTVEDFCCPDELKSLSLGSSFGRQRELVLDAQYEIAFTASNS